VKNKDFNETVKSEKYKIILIFYCNGMQECMSGNTTKQKHYLDIKLTHSSTYAVK